MQINVYLYILKCDECFSMSSIMCGPVCPAAFPAYPLLAQLQPHCTVSFEPAKLFPSLGLSVTAPSVWNILPEFSVATSSLCQLHPLPLPPYLILFSPLHLLAPGILYFHLLSAFSSINYLKAGILSCSSLYLAPRTVPCTQHRFSLSICQLLCRIYKCWCMMPSTT